ncbi:MAG: protoporphyrinogen oxidase [Chloroflexota bacterium]|nr:MAG: protoporphyrinogen oxidase [Chloroflexota bacterium]
MSGSSLRVVVVGGGVTGLAAAHELARLAAERPADGLRVTLIEAADRLGGKVQTDHVDELLLERGPDAVFLRSPFWLELCQRLGLADQVVRANPEHRQSYILRRGRLHGIPGGMEGGVPRSIWPMAASGLLSPWGKVRAALEAIVPAAHPDGDESVDGFIRRRFGAEVAERIALPLLGGIYSNDTRRLSLLATTPHLRAAEREHRSLLLGARRAAHRPAANKGPGSGGRSQSPFVSLRGGLECLTTALAARLSGVDVRPRTRVMALMPTPTGESAFTLALGDGQRLVADRVILTVPAFAAAELLRPLSVVAAMQLDRVNYASAAIVTLAFPAGSITLPHGSGFIVSPDEGRLLSACSWTSQKWPHTAPDGVILLRCHLHATEHATILDLDDIGLERTVRAELGELLGITATPRLTRVYRWPRALASYEVGHLDRLATLDRALADLPGVFLAGAGYRGVGVAECARQGIEAAARTVAVPSPNGVPASVAGTR